MQQDPKQILLQVLTIIDYADEKEAFAEEFLQICHEQAMADLLTSLTEEQKKVLQRTTDIQTTLAQIIPSEQLNKALKEATKIQFQDYLKTIKPSLSQVQKDKLNTFFSSLHSAV